MEDDSGDVAGYDRLEAYPKSKHISNTYFGYFEPLG